MKYKVGDRVRIKSLDWYNENKNEIDEVHCVSTVFIPDMVRYISDIVTISEAFPILGIYRIKEDSGVYNWTDEMIEGLAEEETKPDKVIEEAKTYWDSIKDAWICPDGYQFKDENGNVINATKIVLKKKKEYPKTYEECCKVLDFCGEYFFTTYEGGIHLPENDNIVKIHQILKSTSILTKLLICRDAYWKLYGEEMGLEKPWSPDYTEESYEQGSPIKYVIYYTGTHITKERKCTPSYILSFPTPEMRDAFYENFAPDIEFCKELL